MWLWILAWLLGEVTSMTQPVVAAAVEEKVKLQSGYFPVPLPIGNDPANRDIRSIRIEGKVTPERTGAAELFLDPRQAALNSFGDVVRRPGTEPAPIRVELHYVGTGFGQITDQGPATEDSKASEGFRLYDIVCPGGVVSGRLQLVLGTASLGPHRLLSFAGQKHIVPLEGEPAIKSALPDPSLNGQIDFSGYYSAADGQVRRLEVRGKLGGSGQVAFNPNFIGFDRFGEPAWFTLMGYEFHPATLLLAPDPDPLGQGRRLYWVAPKNLTHFNPVALVLGRTEASPHRVLLYRGGQLSFIGPVFLMARRNQEVETAKYGRLSPGERLAIDDLRQAIGHDFRCEIDNGQAIALFLTVGQKRVLPAGILARLPHLRSIAISGSRSPGAGLNDLRQLSELRTLGFSGVEIEPGDLAALKNLWTVDALSFYCCRGINDGGVRQLAGLTNLVRLSFYSEEGLGHAVNSSPGLTDAGLAHLRGLTRLQQLDLFGHALSDASAAVLAGMHELQDLALSGRGFTDSGLAGLGGLTNLQSLRLFETGITAIGVAALKKRLPQLQIQAWDRDGHD